ncbi:MAG: beta-ketoacyl-ACP synthase [Parvibaculum sp.]|uniref:beta-ketoacyl-ACP synthase n=1 Tax=Parvibaculum sp. TaxID=2024848 RepID=UPI00283E6991|nr:beta-ketoacyl-ACP synthase [Parvibaculum sp.]MDR3500924.1 beta-ketoacyl-ACP synthase [Parvibaculum sp.]
MNSTGTEDAPIYFAAMSAANALGRDWDDVASRLFAADGAGLERRADLNDGRSVPVGSLGFELAALPAALEDWEGRNNRLVYHCLVPLLPEIERVIARFGASRIGVVVGTSTSGIERSEAALRARVETGAWPEGYRFERQELGDPSAFIAAVIGAKGPYYSISTACTSGAKALASAARLLRLGLCGAVIAGGVDTLCGLTLNGFSVLEAMAGERCNPFSVNRGGINIGEGGALFLLTRDEADIRLASWGESADAHHLSAPDPEGHGARLAIEQALRRANIEPSEISYLNLHGTATRLNDAMEARVTHDIFGPELACSSTKGLTGHMLGAAGSNEAAFVAMALSRGEVPPHVWDGEVDPALAALRLVDKVGETVQRGYMMSCSYAFGGNNIALILARD